VKLWIVGFVMVAVSTAVSPAQAALEIDVSRSVNAQLMLSTASALSDSLSAAEIPTTYTEGVLPTYTAAARIDGNMPFLPPGDYAETQAQLDLQIMVTGSTTTIRGSGLARSAVDISNSASSGLPEPFDAHVFDVGSPWILNYGNAIDLVFGLPESYDWTLNATIALPDSELPWANGGSYIQLGDADLLWTYEYAIKDAESVTAAGTLLPNDDWWFHFSIGTMAHAHYEMFEPDPNVNNTNSAAQASFDFELTLTPTDGQGSVVPEPSTIIIWSLLGTLAVTVGYWRRRKVV